MNRATPEKETWADGHKYQKKVTPIRWFAHPVPLAPRSRVMVVGIAKSASSDARNSWGKVR
jgi:hypothetical protein